MPATDTNTISHDTDDFDERSNFRRPFDNEGRYFFIENLDNIRTLWSQGGLARSWSSFGAYRQLSRLLERVSCNDLEAYTNDIDQNV